MKHRTLSPDQERTEEKHPPPLKSGSTSIKRDPLPLESRVQSPEELLPSVIARSTSIVLEVQRLWASDSGAPPVDEVDMLTRFLHQSQFEERLLSMQQFVVQTAGELLEDIDDVMGSFCDDYEHAEPPSSVIQLASMLVSKFSAIRLYLLKTFADDAPAALSLGPDALAGSFEKLQLLLQRERIQLSQVRALLRDRDRLLLARGHMLAKRQALQAACRRSELIIGVLLAILAAPPPHGAAPRARRLRPGPQRAGQLLGDAQYAQLSQVVQVDCVYRGQLASWVPLLSLLRSRPVYFARLLPLLTLRDCETVSNFLCHDLFPDLVSFHDDAPLFFLVRSMIVKRFDTCMQPSQFLRQNTNLSQLLSSFSRRKLCRRHLKTALRPAIQQVIDAADSLDLDIKNRYLDPSPPQEPGLEPACPAEDPAARAALQQKYQLLLRICRTFVDSIFKALPSMPFGLRWICGQILYHARFRFSPLLEEESNILLGSFLFLRFYNPALIVPESYGIIKTKILPKVRQNLTLIAKVLQNLANGVSYGAQDPLMMPMNRFFIESEARLHHFFRQAASPTGMEEYFYESLSDLPLPHSQGGPAAGSCHFGSFYRVIDQHNLLTLHQLLRVNLNEIAPSLTDPLRALLNAVDLPSNVSLPPAARLNEFLFDVPLLPEFSPQHLSPPPKLQTTSTTQMSISPSFSDRSQDGGTASESAPSQNFITSIILPTLNSEESLVYLIKRSLCHILATTPSQSYESDNLLDLLLEVKEVIVKSGGGDASIFMSSEESPLVAIDHLVEQIGLLPPRLADQKGLGLLQEMFQDYQVRRARRHDLQQHQELLQVQLERGRRRYKALKEQSQSLNQYLTSCKLRAFIATSLPGRSLVGPFTFHTQDLIASRILLENHAIPGLRSVKFSSLVPGSITMVCEGMLAGQIVVAHEFDVVSLLFRAFSEDFFDVPPVSFDLHRLLTLILHLFFTIQ